MGTIADKLSYLAQTKGLIKEAIEKKGVTVPGDATFRDYVGLIAKIGEEKVLIGYSYNGTVLPALPEWDKEAYPYAFIAKTSNYKYLFILKEPSYFIGDGVTGDSGGWNIHVDRVATFSDDTGQWEEFRDSIAGYRLVSGLIWADFDMVSRTGSVVMAASEPVPVYE